MTINEYIDNTRANHESEWLKILPKVTCKDGFEMSVQASAGHYCSPRITNAMFYDMVEVGYPSSEEPLLMEYAENSSAPTDTVYGYVPYSIVDAVIEKHGGIVEVAE